MIKSEESALASKYKVTSYPSFFILKHGEKAPIKYEGDTFTYKMLFEFINIYSETFVDPNAVGKQEEESKAKKPWMSMPVPFISKESGNDICLKKDGLCVIYVMKSAADSDPKIVETMQTL